MLVLLNVDLLTLYNVFKFVKKIEKIKIYNKSNKKTILINIKLC